MTALTITIDGKTEVYEIITADMGICLNDVQTNPTMPRVMANHFTAMHNRTVSEFIDKAAYLNRDIVKQDTSIVIENFASPFGIIEPITAIVPTQKELTNMRKNRKVGKTAKTA